MAEELKISQSTDRIERYETLKKQIPYLIGEETNLIANMSNVAAALKQTFNFFWVGFYLVDNDTELILGPFQGPIACTRISKGKGVCGTAWKSGKAQLVANVDEFPGHIACSSDSKSEVVIPMKKDGNVYAVLDVDSDKLDDFSELDVKHLTSICEIISNSI